MIGGQADPDAQKMIQVNNFKVYFLVTILFYLVLATQIGGSVWQTKNGKSDTNWFGKALFYWMYLFQVVVLLLYFATFIGLKRLLVKIKMI